MPWINIGHGRSPKAITGTIAILVATAIAIKPRAPLLPPNLLSNILTPAKAANASPMPTIPLSVTGQGNKPKAIIGNTAKFNAIAIPVKPTTDSSFSSFIMFITIVIAPTAAPSPATPTPS